jgi:hypothetical protein
VCPVAYDERERGHGRGRRTLKIASVAAGLPFPRAAQAIQITRRRKVRGRRPRETCSAVTPLTVAQTAPAGLAAVIRGHWGIEDRSQIRTAAGRLRRQCAALRHHARRPLQTIMMC